MTTRNILSDVSGVVVQIDIKPGEPFKEDQVIMTIESMKMEMVVVPRFSGRLVELLVEHGDVVSEGQVIAMAQVWRQASSEIQARGDHMRKRFDGNIQIGRAAIRAVLVAAFAAGAMRRCKALLLSGVQQKLVALGRALAVGTRLLLDEPFEGVAPALSQRLLEVIFALKEQHLSVIIAQSDLNRSGNRFVREYVAERRANAVQ